MATAPDDVAEFAIHVGQSLQRRRPALSIELAEYGLIINRRYCPLEELYRAVRHSPRRREALVTAFMDRLFNPDQIDSPPAFEEALPRIMPRLYPRCWTQRVGPQCLVAIELTNDVELRFSVDMPLWSFPVSNGTCADWGVTPSALDAIARRNLAALDREDDYHQCGSRGVIITASDGYAASRLLLPGFRERVSIMLGRSQFSLYAPSWDFVIAFCEDQEKVPDWVERIVSVQFARPGYRITSKRLSVTRDGLY